MQGGQGNAFVMTNIKFSHKYTKLLYGLNFIKHAVLLQVLIIDLMDLTQEFRDYDTDFGVYELPKKGKYMLLIFQKQGMSLFTTIRRHTPQKEEYYKGKIGETFQIVIEQKEPAI